MGPPLRRQGRPTGGTGGCTDALSGLGSYYLLVGDSDAASAAQREALEIFVEVGNPTGIAMVLEAMAMIAMVEGRHVRALRLAGASEAVKDQTGGGAPAELMLSGEKLEESRRSLDPETAERAWDEGRAMGTDKAIAYALGG